MADQSKRNDADVQFKKLQQAEDGKKAMSEYEAAQAAERAKTARLKEARLAKEAAEAAARPAASAAPKTKAAKQSKQKPAALSDWLDDQKSGGRRS